MNANIGTSAQTDAQVSVNASTAIGVVLPAQPVSSVPVRVSTRVRNLDRYPAMILEICPPLKPFDTVVTPNDHYDEEGGSYVDEKALCSDDADEDSDW